MFKIPSAFLAKSVDLVHHDTEQCKTKHLDRIFLIDKFEDWHEKLQFKKLTSFEKKSRLLLWILVELKLFNMPNI